MSGGYSRDAAETCSVTPDHAGNACRSRIAFSAVQSVHRDSEALVWFDSCRFRPTLRYSAKLPAASTLHRVLVVGRTADQRCQHRVLVAQPGGVRKEIAASHSGARLPN
jgi:hypothetical protein